MMSPQASPSPNAPIVLVDDEPFALRLLEHQLRQLGYADIRGFDQPSEALALFDASPQAAALVVLDLQMPGIDGVEFLRHLARVGYRGALILASGEDERILQSASRLASAQGLDVRGAVHKPVTPVQLETLLLGGAMAASGSTARSERRYPPDRLREALANGEITAFYQPKVELLTGRCVGAEALVRWQHPEDGLVFPDAFVAMAEEHHLVDDLTKVVLRTALAQARAWSEGGLSLHVAVNLSMDSLGDLDIPEFILGAVEAAGVPRRTLVAEITESRLMTRSLATLDSLTRLRLKHISLSIDDFGTGHSSLAQLRDLPFDELKLDRGFVHGAQSDPTARTILESSIAMAHQLGMRTVAEGVEDRVDWDLLRALRCDLAQGYFIARPMPGDALLAWEAEWDQRRRRELVVGA